MGTYCAPALPDSFHGFSRMICSYNITYFFSMHDSFPHALELSRMDYNAFALIYRPGAQTACEDLARAIQFIFDHAEELEVETDRYSLWGGSAGAADGGVPGDLRAGGLRRPGRPAPARGGHHAVHRPQRVQ